MHSSLKLSHAVNSLDHQRHKSPKHIPFHAPRAVALEVRQQHRSQPANFLPHTALRCDALLKHASSARQRARSRGNSAQKHLKSPKMGKLFHSVSTEHLDRRAGCRCQSDATKVARHQETVAHEKPSPHVFTTNPVHPPTNPAIGPTYPILFNCREYKRFTIPSSL